MELVPPASKMLLPPPHPQLLSQRAKGGHCFWCPALSLGRGWSDLSDRVRGGWSPANEMISLAFRVRSFAANALDPASSCPRPAPIWKRGALSRGRSKEGERVAKGEVLLDIETDKATMEVEAPETGVVMKHFYADGCDRSRDTPDRGARRRERIRSRDRAALI